MNQFQAMGSKLQSRLAKRSADITLNEYWAVGYKALGRKRELKETKNLLHNLRSCQKLDKKLLQLMQSLSWEVEENERWVAAILSHEV